jgi:hypothetical protein
LGARYFLISHYRPFIFSSLSPLSLISIPHCPCQIPLPASDPAAGREEQEEEEREADHSGLEAELPNNDCDDPARTAAR